MEIQNANEISWNSTNHTKGNYLSSYCILSSPCIAKHSQYSSKIGITRCDSAKIRVRIIVTNASNDIVDMHNINIQTKNLQKMKPSKISTQMFLFEDFRRKWKTVRHSSQVKKHFGLCDSHSKWETCPSESTTYFYK